MDISQKGRKKGRKEVRSMHVERGKERREEQGCQIAKFDPFLSLDCARV